jgi:hypothetical protein
MTVRVTPAVWSDPGARDLILGILKSKTTACAAINANEAQNLVSLDRYALGCDKREPPRYQVWLNITREMGDACVATSSNIRTCAPIHVDDSRAFRVR